MTSDHEEGETTASKIAGLEERRRQVYEASESSAVERQASRGKLTARQRIELLVDPGSFGELDALARRRARFLGDRRRPGHTATGSSPGSPPSTAAMYASSPRTSACSGDRSERCSGRRW